MPAFISTSLVNQVALGSDLFAASANTYVGQLIPKYWGVVHFGARGGPAQFSVIFARQNEWQ